MARARAGQAAAEAFGKVGTVSVPRDADSNGAARDTPEAPPVPQGPAQRRAAGKPATTPPPEAVPEMSKARRQRWIFALDGVFGKAAAAIAKSEDAMVEVTQLVADARQAELPEHLIEAAARPVDMEIPKGP